VLAKSLPTAESYGESWEISDHPLHRSLVASGPKAGLSLHQLMAAERSALLGPAANSYQQFPWLVKFLDVADWLSVQVHPGEEAVRRLWPGEGSKTEAWLVLTSEPGSRIYAGLLPGINERKLRAALESGTVASCLHHFSPAPGDCVFLPAGTVHAAGGGVLLAEVQQTSDATFRLFDWNRRDSQGKTRPLHIDEAMACINWDGGPVEPVRCLGFPRSLNRKDINGEARQTLTCCSYFRLDYVRATEPFVCGGSNQLQVLVVLHGHGCFADSEEKLMAGQSWLLPATMSEMECCPDGSIGVLLCSLP
jgi:mannose-6-phosphate isomerase